MRRGGSAGCSAPGTAWRSRSQPLHLYDPGSYTVGESGGREHVAQQAIFYLPLVVVLVFGALAMAALVVPRDGDPVMRRARLWFLAYEVLVLVGALREATIIASVGEPIVDLLVAFGPFALSGVCLWASDRTLRRTAVRSGSRVRT